MIQALSIGFRPKCHLEYVHDVPACLPLRCCSKLSMPTASRALTNYVIKGLTFRSPNFAVSTDHYSRGAKRICNERDPAPGWVEALVRGDPRLTASERVNIYATAYFCRLLDCLYEEFPPPPVSLVRTIL